jgi:hypothetical protein
MNRIDRMVFLFGPALTHPVHPANPAENFFCLCPAEIEQFRQDEQD